MSGFTWPTVRTSRRTPADDQGVQVELVDTSWRHERGRPLGRLLLQRHPGALSKSKSSSDRGIRDFSLKGWDRIAPGTAPGPGASALPLPARPAAQGVARGYVVPPRRGEDRGRTENLDKATPGFSRETGCHADVLGRCKPQRPPALSGWALRFSNEVGKVTASRTGCHGGRPGDRTSSALSSGRPGSGSPSRGSS
ncbi:MAG: hypothetical protein JWO38_4188 [Gemmataceae bacterium]|nr:hypothetical protein [Gemmataceae bacterium]